MFFKKEKTKEIKEEVKVVAKEKNNKKVYEFENNDEIKDFSYKNVAKDVMKFMKDYINSKNAATGAKYDSNANVTKKSIKTMETEMFKLLRIYVSRETLKKAISKYYDGKLANKYLRLLDEHIIYKHDEAHSYGKSYCASVTLTPMMLNGTKELGGPSAPPTNADSFCGQFVNLVMNLSNQFAGAIATVTFLLDLNYYLTKEYGKRYLEVPLYKRRIRQLFQQVVYTINEPSRGDQSVFWNISIFDKYFFDSIFGTYRYPDTTKPVWEDVDALQKFFMEWFQEERKKELLTFPVVTMAMVRENGKLADLEFAEWVAKRMTDGDDFFIYMGPPSALSSCCRLKNDIQQNEFSYSLGAGGVMTGSISVITINLPRLVQKCKKENKDFFDELRNLVKDVQKFNIAYKKYVKEEIIDKGLYPAYSAGYIALNKQYVTIGVNGLPEAYYCYSDFTDFDINYENKNYVNWCGRVLDLISEENRKTRQETGHLINTELVPAESLAAKFRKWDEEDGYYKFDNLYSSYFYMPDDENISYVEKFMLYGQLDNRLDGGAALHLNLGEPLTYETAMKLLEMATISGITYWTWNIPRTVCENCGHIEKKTLNYCVECGSENVYHATRVIGYLKPIKNFSADRQKEAETRHYHTEQGD